MTADVLSSVKDLVEFYFSDSNFRRDKFLQKAAEETGFVDIKTLLTFNKLKALTTDPAVVAEALATSETLELSEAKDSIKRKLVRAADWYEVHRP